MGKRKVNKSHLLEVLVVIFVLGVCIAFAWLIGDWAGLPGWMEKGMPTWSVVGLEFTLGALMLLSITMMVFTFRWFIGYVTGWIGVLIEYLFEEGE